MDIEALRKLFQSFKGGQKPGDVEGVPSPNPANDRRHVDNELLEWLGPPASYNADGRPKTPYEAVQYDRTDPEYKDKQLNKRLEAEERRRALKQITDEEEGD